MLFTATGAQMAPPHGYRQLYVSGSIWSLPGAYGRIIMIITIATAILLLLLLLVLVMVMVGYSCTHKNANGDSNNNQ
jgi:uncharacterized membrane protein